MPGLDEHQGIQTIKGLIVGDPGTGKTGCLASLVRAGYKLRIWDFDNLLSSLGTYVKKTCPEKAGNVKYVTLTDQWMSTPLGGPMPKGMPMAFSKGLALLDKWEDGTVPATWDQDTIVVIDSLSTMTRAAKRMIDALNPGAGNKGGPDPRTIIGKTQDIIINTLQMLGEESFKPHVLMLAHIDYETDQLGVMKGFPRTVGKAINSVVGGYFNCIVQLETVLASPPRRIIKLNSTGIVDLKNPVAFDLPVAELPIETGMADLFAAVRKTAPK